jgi:hypothetical protein
MHDDPSMSELLHGVIEFMAVVAGPQLSGHAQFQARVAANALALIARDLECRADNQTQAVAAYRALLQSDQTDLRALEQSVCGQIQTGEFDVTTPNLLAVLRQVCVNQIMVDQPNYSGVKL